MMAFGQPMRMRDVFSMAQGASLVRRNCLVLGPAGCGKLSLVRSIFSAASDRSQLFLFDLEIEPATQLALVEQLVARSLSDGCRQSEIWILRKLDSLTDAVLGRLLIALQRQLNHVAINENACRRILYATARTYPSGAPVNRIVDSLFPLQIHLPGLPSTPGELRPFVYDLLGELSIKHGKSMNRIDSQALDLLATRPWTANLLELRSVLERAFLMEDSDSLTPLALTRAMEG